jgi:hypothetical protein
MWPYATSVRGLKLLAYETLPSATSACGLKLLVGFTHQVALQALHTFQENSAAYKVLGLVDALCKISSQVREDQVLHTNIKNVVRNALLCEKVRPHALVA